MQINITQGDAAIIISIFTALAGGVYSLAKQGGRLVAVFVDILAGIEVQQKTCLRIHEDADRIHIKQGELLDEHGEKLVGHETRIVDLEELVD